MRLSTNDTNNQPIEEGDRVKTRFHGVTREGEVRRIVTTQEEADEEGVRLPPKVLFKDQFGKDAAHNPRTLEIIEANERAQQEMKEEEEELAAEEEREAKEQEEEEERRGRH